MSSCFQTRVLASQTSNQKSPKAEAHFSIIVHFQTQMGIFQLSNQEKGERPFLKICVRLDAALQEPAGI